MPVSDMDSVSGFSFLVSRFTFEGVATVTLAGRLGSAAAAGSVQARSAGQLNPATRPVLETRHDTRETRNETPET